MAWYSGITSAVKKAATAVKNYVAPPSNTFKPTPTPSFSATSLPGVSAKKTTQPLVSASNVIGAGGTSQSSFGGSGAVSNPGSSGYSYSQGVSTGSNGLSGSSSRGSSSSTSSSSKLPAKNQITTSSGTQYTLQPLNISLAGGNTSQGSFNNTLTSGTQTIAGGQQILPNSLSPTSRMGGSFILGNASRFGGTEEQQQTQQIDQGVNPFEGNKGLLGAVGGLLNNAYMNARYGSNTGIMGTKKIIEQQKALRATNSPLAPVGQDVPPIIDAGQMQEVGTGNIPPMDDFGGTTDDFNDIIDTTFGEEKAMIDQVYPPEPALLADEQVNQFNLQEEYNRLQEQAGIPDLIAQIKDLQNQQLALGRTIDTVSQEILDDPDYSMNSKERRISYLTGQSAAGVSYRDATRRLEALGGLLDQQNEQIKTQLGFAQQDYQNAFEYQKYQDQKNAQAADEYDIQDGFLLNKTTGEYKQIDGSGSMSQEDRTAVQKAYYATNPTADKYNVVQDNWDTNIMGQLRDGDIKNGSITSDAINRLRSNGSAISTIAIAIGRMAKPDITRGSEGDVQAMTEAGSIIGMTKEALGQAINDDNMNFDKMQQLIEQGIVLQEGWERKKYEADFDWLSRNPEAYGIAPVLPKAAFVFNATQNGYTKPKAESAWDEYLRTGQFPKANGGSSSASSTGMRTDRHNNPTAFTTDIAKLAGLKEGVDYTRGDSFSDGKYYTAKLIGDPIATTIKVIDKIGFQTASGGQRWTYINMPKAQWDKLSYAQKKSVIGQMYQHEGGKTLASLFTSNTA